MIEVAVNMLIHIDTKRGVPYYRQVKEQITQMILSGQLVKGTQLESVANLSKRLKVNPMTISKAYSFLVEEQLLERRPGIGVFVAEIPQAKRQEKTNVLLSGLLQKAAALALQMGLSQEETESLFRQAIVQVRSQEGSDDR